MEKIEGLNIDRIEWCCAIQRISPEELAANVGISTRSMQKLLSREDSITYNQLKRLADHFNRGVLFFLEDGPVDEAQLFTPAFRTITNQRFDLDSATRAVIERAEKQRDVYISLIEDAPEDAPVFAHPELPANPADAADRARVWLGLGDRNDFSSFRASVESKGILVFLTNGYQGRWQIPKGNPILGFSLYHSEFPVIVVKKSQFEARQSFTLFHELAHLLLHRASVIDDEASFSSYAGNERTANKFAAHLLVPDVLVPAIDVAAMPDRPEQYDDWLRPYRTKWGVSTEMLLLRLVSHERITQSHYEEYKAWWDRQEIPESNGGTRLYRHREPRNIFGDRYVRSVLGALERDEITLNKASKFLDGIKVDDIRRLEAYCATR